MKKFHVHIYEVSKQYETNLEAENDEEARKIALEMVKTGKPKLLELKKTDCKHIVIDFEI
jgi:hypothetical protein